MVLSATLVSTQVDEHAVMGIFTIESIRFKAFTLELPSRENQRRISCIPSGRYYCALVNSPRFGRVYGIHDVPGRDHILIHAGNTVAHTEGCILLGEAVSWKGRRVINSRAAVASLAKATGNAPFWLDVRVQ